MRTCLWFVIAILLGFLLCGCAVVRTPVMLAAAADAAPVPPGGTRAITGWRPFLESPHVEMTLHVPGDRESAARFYRERLLAKGWTLLKDSSEDDPPAHSISFVRGTYFVNQEWLTVCTTSSPTGEGATVVVDLTAYYLMDAPGQWVFNYPVSFMVMVLRVPEVAVTPIMIWF